MARRMAATTSSADAPGVSTAATPRRAAWRRRRRGRCRRRRPGCRAPLAQLRDHLGAQRHVRARQHRQPDGVDVLVDSRPRRPSRASGTAPCRSPRSRRRAGCGRRPSPPVVPVEADLGHEDRGRSSSACCSRRSRGRSCGRAGRPRPCGDSSGGGAWSGSLNSWYRLSATASVVSRPIRSARRSGPIGWLQPSTMPVSMSSAVAKPDSIILIADSRYGMSSAFTTKPARSWLWITRLCSVSSANASARSAVSGRSSAS